MPIPVPTPIATGFADAFGCAYRVGLDQLLVVDAGNQTISSVTVHTHVKTVVGTGYAALHDIELSSDGLHAYVADADKLLRVPLSNLNHAAASVVASSLGTNVSQLALDEVRGVGYVVGGGNLKRINLTTGAVTALPGSFANARGLLITSDGRFVYVSSDDDTIRRVDLQTNAIVTMASGLNAPRFMEFTDASESVIVFPQPNPTAQLWKLDLTTTPPSVAVLAGPAGFAPYGVAVIAPNKMIVVCAQQVDEVDFTSGVYSAAGPVLLGIGFVPNDAVHIVSGYADTHMDPSYFFQVRNCPFGGTLPLLINHDWARTHSAAYYQIQITPAGGALRTVNQSYTDYLWSTPLNAFEAQTTSPVGGLYPVHAAGAIWLNYWLGMLLDTTGLPNGPLKIQVRLFKADRTTEVGSAADPGRTATLMLDNTQPTARLNAILHDGATVGTCGLVTSGSTNFTFNVTADAPKHLLGWSLTAYWGDNKSATVASDNYSNHVAGGPIWPGIANTIVPTPAWNCYNPSDPTSKHCGHSFFLYAWDRVINGWGYVHGAAGYQKTITILL